MANTQQPLPVSAIIKGKGDKEPPTKQSKEEWRKAKELEEARKAGTAPAEQDEEGKDINPHIPLYIAKAPWYYHSAGPTLKHQRNLRAHAANENIVKDINKWYKKGVIQGSTSTKWRKGACENCGALTHQKKDCLERPRKVGAKWSGEMIAPDEHVPEDLDFTFDGKRDRWANYDPSDHKQVIEEHNQIEEAKRQLKAQRMQEELQRAESQEEASRIKKELMRLASEGSAPEEAFIEEEEDKYADHAEMPGTKFKTGERITIRNLRIREDTAKYLRNLDPESAYYDPKTRSMRENPYRSMGKGPKDVDYAGDNFIRASGDSYEHSKAQQFAWTAYNTGVDTHLQAEPTKLELLRKEYDVQKDQVKQTVKDSVLAKYGGAEHLDGPPSQLLMAQSENYVEYSRTGAVIKGQEKTTAKSRYEEDVYNNNHTTVWGSYWNSGEWGYKCCHSTVKHSYCTGESGRAAQSASTLVVHPGSSSAVESDNDNAARQQVSLLEQHKEKSARKKNKKKSKSSKKKGKKRKDDSSSSSSSSSSDSSSSENSSSSSSSSDSSDTSSSEDEDGEFNKKKLAKALKREERRNKDGKRLLKLDDRKRPYNSMEDVVAPTEVEMEAYNIKKMRHDDPMAGMM